MFERFNVPARNTVVAAQERARRLGDTEIGTQHLLLGLVEQPTTLSSRLLAAHGLDSVAAAELNSRLTGDLDADALGALGIDLGEVRARVEATFGPGALDRPREDRHREDRPREDRPRERGTERRRSRLGHLPLSRRAKKTFELALREAQRLDHPYIGDGHLLLGLLRQADSSAYRIMVGAGIDPVRLCSELEQQIPPGLAAEAG